MNTRLEKTINPFKRRFFKFLTSSLKNSKNLKELPLIKKNDIKHVLIVRSNHRLGNQLLISPLVQVIESEFPEGKVDLLVNGGLSNIIYKNYSNVDQIYQLPKKPFKNLIEYIKVSLKIMYSKYDIAIVGTEDSNSSKIFVKLSRAKFKIFNLGTIDAKQPKHIAKKPIYNLMNFITQDEKEPNKKYPKLDIKLNENEILNGKKILTDFFSSHLKTIVVFTNATGNKKLSKKWWKDFCKQLKMKFPNTNILEILPKENISQLDFAFKTYLSGDLREMASVIENCSVFIGTDSGIMHLATSTNTPTFGLFNGTTNPETYGPYGRFKYTIETHKTEHNEIIKKIKVYFE